MTATTHLVIGKIYLITFLKFLDRIYILIHIFNSNITFFFRNLNYI